MEQTIDEVLEEMYQTITVEAIQSSSSYPSSYPVLTSFLEHFY
ncbi:hypothetical protein [Paenibacillus apiarius]|nr:hypothetical protein [Paenibacillus apiarius]MEC0118539.1 hypothetical protein [Paenibacillus apiarius]MEC0193419.1 hypothetical protein [Paenibacillus apiarius]